MFFCRSKLSFIQKCIDKRVSNWLPAFLPMQHVMFQRQRERIACMCRPPIGQWRAAHVTPNATSPNHMTIAKTAARSTGFGILPRCTLSALVIDRRNEVVSVKCTTRYPNRKCEPLSEFQGSDVAARVKAYKYFPLNQTTVQTSQNPEQWLRHLD